MKSLPQETLRSISRICFGSACCLMIYGCTTVKPYERQYLNDIEMQFNNASFESYAVEIRQAALSPAFEKDTGGCGCN